MKFLNHLTLGQYVPADSLVHALDPRCKILAAVLLMTGVFTVQHPVSFLAWGGLLLAVTYASQLSPGLVLRGARPVLILIVFTALIHLFFTEGELLWSWGILRVTEEGAVAAVRMAVRLLMLVLFAGLLTLTTAPMELADGLEKLFAPLVPLGFPAHEMAMMMTIALRFIPTLLDETDRIMKAQLARGADLDRGGLFRRVKAFIPVLVPLFVIVFQRAEELATAMEARCYRGGTGRTRLRPLRWQRRDS
ncbi:MAG: energy-coupling factor transporter transmembrane protein EcfT, partial [Synergistales bacterium]|nr:energy-coupling factor transporter transmembrane protein EcfT [Synergistales bacterium]